MLWVLIAAYLIIGLVVRPYSIASNIARGDSLTRKVTLGIVFHALWLPLFIYFIIALHIGGFGGWV